MADFAVVDDPIQFLYAVKTTEGAWAAGVPVDGCQIFAVSKDDVLKNPALLQKDSAAVHLWRKCLQGIVPKIGDKMEQDFGTGFPDSAKAVWMVVSVSVLDRDRRGPQRYRVVVIRSTGAQSL
jgi:hypothetical protein